MVLITRSDAYLEHHGINGQKWGVRHGPPYPLDYDDHSPAQKKANPKSELNNYENNNPVGERPASGSEHFKTDDTEEKKSQSSQTMAVSDAVEHAGKAATDSALEKLGNRPVNVESKKSGSKGKFDLQTSLGLTDEETARLKKQLKVAGIVVGTTAAVVAAGYLYYNYTNLDEGYNLDSSRRRFGLNDRLFKNTTNGSYLGHVAKEHGYHVVRSDVLADAINNPDREKSLDYDELVQNVRNRQLSQDGMRRLSCWSASNAYYMSAMTGGDYVSKNFQNLVDFNDFGKLYTEKPKIYNVAGMRAANFVGKFGKLGFRGGEQVTDAVSKSLVSNIFKNINESNNLSADGSRTIGFINAGYHSTTCTHQFNFEIVHGAGGIKNLFIADGYSGDRYSVGILNEAGKVSYNGSGLAKLSKELHHYNAESLRFYAPALDTINTAMMSNVILGK